MDARRRYHWGMGAVFAVGRTVVAFVGLVALTMAPACHLAESPDPLTCPAGSHADTGRCVQDATTPNTIRIALDDAGACEASPHVLGIASTDHFQFENDDTVDHVVLGSDGQTWATLKAGETSPFIGITKIGHWDYDVSGCAMGGTVTILQ